MSFPRYDNYQDSDVELLGEVPTHWDVWKLAHAFTQIGSGTTPKSDKAEYYDEGTIPWVNTGDLDDGLLTECAKNITERAAEDHSTLKLYPAGSLLFAMYGATIGKLGMLEFPATVNQACCVFSGESPITAKFLFYWFLGLRQKILSLATGGGQPNVSQDILRTLKVACPDKDEQKAISSFLDVETSKIDGLVSEQRRLIELLKEKRQAVISHAVTKGLNPNAPMKPSGIQWLGDVPQHWTPIRLRHACSHIFLGLTSKVDYVEEGGVPLVRLTNIEGGKLDLSNVRHISVEQHKRLTSHRRAMLGDVLLGKSGSIGTTAIIDTDTEFSIYESLFALRPQRSLLTSVYLTHLLRSPCCANQFRASSVGMGVGHLNMSDIVNVYVVLPPTNEQEEIGAYLDSEVQTFSQLQAEAERAIELLQERRTALISAAVTGKIDVREFVDKETV